METPIFDFLRSYAQKVPIRLHMPGHKGTEDPADITEICGADVLYASDGIIRRSEDNAAALFGAARTIYSAEGSSLSIRAMLVLLQMYARESGETARILAFRNTHKVFVMTAALLDIPVQWVFPQDGSYLSCAVSAQHLDALLAVHKPTAVYLTSPDYLGNCAELSALSAVCRKHGVLLAVDNAHGAYLRFLPQSMHPLQNGADLCCDSAHKTLPVLTGGGYLHIAHTAPQFFAQNAEQAMALFASTSPSYLILQSLDKANALLDGDFRKELAVTVEKVRLLREKLTQSGFCCIGDEPLKLTVMPKSYGYTGTALDALLREKNIYCEFADADHLVMMFSPCTASETFAHVQAALCSVPQRTPIRTAAPQMRRPIQTMRAHEALFSNARTLPVRECVGKVLASATVSCPPAVPVLACGERVEADAAAVLDYYGIRTLRVVDAP